MIYVYMLSRRDCSVAVLRRAFCLSSRQGWYVVAKGVLVMMYDHRSMLQRMNEGTSVVVVPKRVNKAKRIVVEGGKKGWRGE